MTGHRIYPTQESSIYFIVVDTESPPPVMASFLVTVSARSGLIFSRRPASSEEGRLLHLFWTTDSEYSFDVPYFCSVSYFDYLLARAWITTTSE